METLLNLLIQLKKISQIFIYKLEPKVSVVVASNIVGNVEMNGMHLVHANKFQVGNQLVSKMICLTFILQQILQDALTNYATCL